jgi:hypothetical protein
VLTIEHSITPDPGVIGTTLHDGETVLLHMGTRQYHSLNATGTYIWQLIGEGRTLEEISRALEARYDVSLDRAQSTVLELASELVAANLAQMNDSR